MTSPGTTSRVGFATLATALAAGLLTPAPAAAAAGDNPHAASYSDAAVNACAQMCACPAPNGIFIPAVPNPNASHASEAEHTAAASAPGTPGAPAPYHHAGGLMGRHPSYPAPDEPIDYPTAQVDRPLVLPPGMTEPELSVTIYNDSQDGGAPVRERALFGSQSALPGLPGWQLGAAVRVTSSTRVALDSIDVTGQRALLPELSARLDVGLRHSVCPDGSSAFAAGVGLPFKYRLNPHLAVISGRPELIALGDDVVSWDSRGCGAAFTLGIPVGLSATLGGIYNFGVRSGYRQLLGSGNASGGGAASGAGASRGFIPLAFDFALVIGTPGASQADVGLSFELPNALGSPTDLERRQSAWFEQRLIVYAQTRL